MQQFSVMFQDFKLLALPLGENVGAALDPISEHEIYSGFRRLIGEKTAVFISHRLSSCRFRHCGEGFGKGNHVSLSSSAEVWNPLQKVRPDKKP